MSCSKCGADTEFRQGISKKNNKPWQGNKCLDPECGNMDFVRSNGNQRFQGTPQAPYQAPKLPTPQPVQKNGKDREASIASLALCKVMARANAYTLGKTERLEMLDAVYSDYITFRNRLLGPGAEEVGF